MIALVFKPNNSGTDFWQKNVCACPRGEGGQRRGTKKVFLSFSSLPSIFSITPDLRRTFQTSADFSLFLFFLN